MGVPKQIKVLIGGRSGYGRLVMRDILAAEPGIEVVDTASDGEELYDKARSYRPDVIVLDVDLPRNARLLNLKRILETYPVPLVFSGPKDRLDMIEALQAIERTAYDLLVQPDNVQRKDLRKIAASLIGKVKRMASVTVKNPWLGGGSEAKDSGEEANFKTSLPTHLVVLGASTGGSQAVEYVVRELPRDFPGAVLIAQHMPSGFTSTFARRLSAVSSLAVEEGIPGLTVERGQVIVAPGSANMAVAAHMGSRSNLCIENYEGRRNGHDMPSVDVLMESAVRLYKENTIGVLLSGLGQDGVNGLGLIKNAGGTTIAQDEYTSAVFGMPKAAIEKGYVKTVLPLADIPKRIVMETRIVR